ERTVDGGSRSRLSARSARPPRRQYFGGREGGRDRPQDLPPADQQALAQVVRRADGPAVCPRRDSSRRDCPGGARSPHPKPPPTGLRAMVLLASHLGT